MDRKASQENKMPPSRASQETPVSMLKNSEGLYMIDDRDRVFACLPTELLEAYADDPEGLAELKARNLEKYGHEEGPLPEDLAQAFEEAWDIAKAGSPEYYTLYKGKGSVGGESKEGGK